MDISQIPLFALADKRLAWVASRQSVLAQNIANADTSGYRAKDVAPFAALLTAPGLGLAATTAGHFAGSASTAPKITVTRGEHAPDGNTVALDKELGKVADTDMAHEVAVGLEKKYLGMFRTTLGR